MAWFILGLVVYYLVLFSERALMGITPHQMELLRAEHSRSARNAQHLIAHIRPALGALLMARVVLQILITVFVAVAVELAGPETITAANAGVT